MAGARPQRTSVTSPAAGPAAPAPPTAPSSPTSASPKRWWRPPDKAGYRCNGTSLTKPGKGHAHRAGRPSSPFSTDGSTMGTHSLGHQRAARPTRKHRAGRLEQGATPHRRDASADDLPPPPTPALPGGACPGPRSGWDPRSAGSAGRGSAGHRTGPGSEEGLLPYSKPCFPSPGGHSSSGTASSKGSTGPRKGGEGTRGPTNGPSQTTLTWATWGPTGRGSTPESYSDLVRRSEASCSDWPLMQANPSPRCGAMNSFLHISRPGMQNAKLLAFIAQPSSSSLSQTPVFPKLSSLLVIRHFV
ncbi:hypothetical protein ANANG_G00240470 [Anguilla anguilla]|uniref:Uncharacterized protein n=1 Tax=Anguilla anguilla TaxID=7936 RepID=A0A9D3LV30_ANGAN|nr:hypothetical protein ANANG_G00240470 [Anguilla anguilla]